MSVILPKEHVDIAIDCAAARSLSEYLHFGQRDPLPLHYIESLARPTTQDKDVLIVHTAQGEGGTGSAKCNILGSRTYDYLRVKPTHNFVHLSMVRQNNQMQLRQ